jgi:fructokinase
LNVQTGGVITVVGEALVDLVISPDGQVSAALGGAPFNTARAAARLGADVAFVGALSSDRFGDQLAAALCEDGVDVTGAPRVDAPTTLAVAELDESGAAAYRFYVEGTSAPRLDRRPDIDHADVIVTGGLGLILEPMASVIETTLATRPRATVMVDVNCRPPLIADRDHYRVRVERVVAIADIVKVSDDDLAVLYPTADPADAASRLLEIGADVVLVTRGASGVDIITRDATRLVPVDPVEVVDTVGAGDTFDGALLAWLSARGSFDPEVLTMEVLARAVTAANVAAGIACTRRGADPPRRSEVPDSWWP